MKRRAHIACNVGAASLFRRFYFLFIYGYKRKRDRFCKIVENSPQDIRGGYTDIFYSALLSFDSKVHAIKTNRRIIRGVSGAFSCISEFMCLTVL